MYYQEKHKQETKTGEASTKSFSPKQKKKDCYGEHFILEQNMPDVSLNR